MRYLRHLPSREGEEAGLTAARDGSAARGGTAARDSNGEQRRTGRALAVVVFVVGGAVLTGLPLCPFGGVTGIACPACGLGRATLSLLRGDLAHALHLHPLAPIAAPALAGLVIASRGVRRASARVWVTRTAGLLFGLLLVVWSVRLAGGLGGLPPVDTYARFLERGGGHVP